jgi:hypothetical protein
MQVHVHQHVPGIQTASLEQWATLAIEHALDRLADPSMEICASLRAAGAHMQCHMRLERAGARRLTVCTEAESAYEAISKSADTLERRLRRQIRRRRALRCRRRC